MKRLKVKMKLVQRQIWKEEYNGCANIDGG